MVALAKAVCRRALRKIYEQEFLSSLPSRDLRTKIGEHHAALNSEHGVQFLFADYTLDADTRELRRGDTPIPVQPRVFDLLAYLLQNRERVVSKHDLLSVLWGGRTVADSTVATHINAARKAVGDSASEQKLIRTIAREASGSSVPWPASLGVTLRRVTPLRRAKRSSHPHRRCRLSTGLRSPCFPLST